MASTCGRGLALRVAIIAPLLGSCFQPWKADGLYACSAGSCPSDMTCDDGVCCRADGTPECPTLVPKSGTCADGSTPKQYFADDDMDGFGTAAKMRLACSKPLSESWVDNSMDCDDTSAAAKPGGTEICDGHDNNCNGVIDEGQSPTQSYFPDVDGDQHGAADAGSIMACRCDTCTPPGYSVSADDCFPNDANKHPGAPEMCNGIDDNCNGMTDENVTIGVDVMCADAGQGVCSAGITRCVGGRLVCAPNIAPSLDKCDGLDNDCDGLTDEQPDCGGPNQLLAVNMATIGARNTNTTDAGPTPSSCLKNFGAATNETWTQPTWSGSSTSFHVWYAQAPTGVTWDLSRPGLKLHLQWTTSMTNFNTSSPWNQFGQPIVLVCNANGNFSRYRANKAGNPNGTLLPASNSPVNTDMPMAGGGDWILATADADLKSVTRVEVVVEPRDNGASIPGFTITFNNATGFKP